MLETAIEGLIEVRDKHIHQGRERVEASLVSDDGQTLYLYEGQLKEVGPEGVVLEVGKRYKVGFRLFVNNRWVEVKLVRLTPA
jgi:hypothetical protein